MRAKPFDLNNFVLKTKAVYQSTRCLRLREVARGSDWYKAHSRFIDFHVNGLYFLAAYDSIERELSFQLLA